ncbi:hypothetical protein BDU57DRAFT_531196 [Ampelomyces quisqualis]|uniref:ribonuclease Z n=1 Tax=Ampelomyces quisqualis TaxID=50730 RepID=A0A6A5QHF6_AMPQU|nr:hypothetical protein BDU57DRAFT_531196 [Ampelomyces quisqualis]
MAPINVETAARNIIVSGGARGIGRALSRMFLEGGHKVFILDIDDEELQYTTRVHLNKYYEEKKVESAICDLRNVNDIRAKVKEAAKFFNNNIDVLINNGGIASPQWKDGKTMEDPDTFEEWQAYIDTNLTGPFAMSQACIPFMKSRQTDAKTGAHIIYGAGPSIIHIGSFRAHQSDPNQEGYASSKAGQLGLMHSMAISLGPLGIRVNLIAPGRIKAAHECREGDEQGMDWKGQVSEKDVGDHPVNRAGRPKDIADAALWLMEAGFVNDESLTSLFCQSGALASAASTFTAAFITTATRASSAACRLRPYPALSPRQGVCALCGPYRHALNSSPSSCRAYSGAAPAKALLRPLLEPLEKEHLRRQHAREAEKRAEANQRLELHERTRMSVKVEMLTTPTSDTPGTIAVLRAAAKHYVFGSMAEGTQRAIVQQGARLLKVQDFFLTGRAEWKNTGGLVGMMLTMADASSSSYEQAMEGYREAQARGRTPAHEPLRAHFNIHGPPNLKHTLGTCRRFIFRKGIPILATEYADTSTHRDADGRIPPAWDDGTLQVWPLAVSPVGYQQDAQTEAELDARRQAFDARLNSFADHQAPANESPEDREARYDRIRTATLKFMFDSNWRFDTLVERHISEVRMPAAMFVRNPATHGYEPYTGPKPGGSEPVPDIKVFARTPWPGANILSMPPTSPAPQSVSYIVRTYPARGQFDPARAKSLGVTQGPDFGKLTSGQSVQNKDGDWIEPSQVLGDERPGQGIAFLDVPSLGYLKAIVQREELNSSQVMAGVGAIVWMLGPNLSTQSVLLDFMAKLSNVQHILASTDVAPNRISYDSVAGQATRLGQIDPSRYSVPNYDNDTTPQKNIFNVDSVTHAQSSPLPKGVTAGERGMNFVLMPRFRVQEETKSALFHSAATAQETDEAILRLAKEAQQAVSDEEPKMQQWRKLLARPDTEVITLGTGSALPSKYRNVSATLVRVPGVGNYLLDCGENTLGQLTRVFPPEELQHVIRNLRVIWISHLHADHHLGTAGLIRAWYQLVHEAVPNPEKLDATTLVSKSNDFGLSVISHSGMLQWLYEYSSVEDFGYSRILPLRITANDHGTSSVLEILNSFDGTKMSNHGIQRSTYQKLFGFEDIQSATVAHCHGAMAVSMTFPRSLEDDPNVKPLKVSYSGDCRPSYHFAKIGRHSTVLIHEATFDDELQGDAKAKKHSTTSEALGIGSQMDAKAVVLTHFSQRYQKIPVLQTVKDGESEDPLLDTKATAEEANDDDDVEVDPTLENADNMDIHPSTAAIAPKVSTLQQSTSTPAENERVIKIRNPNMKVAIAFDYMRVKIGEIIQMEKYNEALNALLVKDKDEEGAAGEGEEKINGNGKKTSGDEDGGIKKKQKQKQKQADGTPKKEKTKRSN